METRNAFLQNVLSKRTLKVFAQSFVLASVILVVTYALGGATETKTVDVVLNADAKFEGYKELINKERLFSVQAVNATCANYTTPCAAATPNMAPPTTPCATSTCAATDCCYLASTCQSFAGTCAYNQVQAEPTQICPPGGCTTASCCPIAQCTTVAVAPMITITFYSDAACATALNSTNVNTTVTSGSCACATLGVNPLSIARFRCTSTGVNMTIYQATTTCDVRATNSYNQIQTTCSPVTSVLGAQSAKVTTFTGCSSFTIVFIFIIITDALLDDNMRRSTGYGFNQDYNALTLAQIGQLIQNLLNEGTKLLITSGGLVLVALIDIRNLPTEADGITPKMMIRNGQPRTKGHRVISYGLGIVAAIIKQFDAAQATLAGAIIPSFPSGVTSWTTDVVLITRFGSTNIVSAVAFVFQLACTSALTFAVCRFELGAGAACTQLTAASGQVTGPDTDGFCTITSEKTSAFVGFTVAQTTTTTTSGGGTTTTTTTTTFTTSKAAHVQAASIVMSILAIVFAGLLVL